MFRFASLLLPLLFVGCASVSEMRANAPDFIAATAKSPAEVVACIVDGWQDSAKVVAAKPVISNPLPGGGYSIIDPDTANGATFTLVDIRPMGTKSEVKLYQQPGRPNLFSYYTHRIAVAKGCI